MTPPLEPSVPSTLGAGRYRVDHPLGEGGMASVFVGYDLRLGRRRAIKTMHARFAKKKQARVRFETEARAMAAVEHPNVVRVFDVGIEDRTPYIVMELVEGASLDDIVADEPMHPAEAVDAMIQLCRGVEAAHARGIVHRDIKPQNVLVTTDGVCKLTDFGIAQVTHDDRLTKTGSAMGTLGFMAPEQRYDAKGATVRADIFSLGATLWRLLSWHEPTELFMASEQPQLMAHLHPALTDVVVRCVQYHPEARYETVAELRAALEAVAPQVENATPAPAPRQASARPHDTMDGATLDREPPTVETTDERRARREAAAEMLADGLPAYVDRDSLTARAPVLPDTFSTDSFDTYDPSESGDARVVARDEVHGDPPPQLAKELLNTVYRAVRAVVTGPLSVVGIPVAIIMVVGTIVMTGATWHVRTAEMAARTAQGELYATIDSEERIIEDLASSGVNATYLEGLLAAVRTQPEPLKQKAAITYVESVHDVARPITTAAVGHRAVMAKTRLERLQAARERYESSMLTWDQRADSSVGRLAVSLGAASAP